MKSSMINNGTVGKDSMTNCGKTGSDMLRHQSGADLLPAAANISIQQLAISRIYLDAACCEPTKLLAWASSGRAESWPLLVDLSNVA
jgi:hypothetical protein